MKLNRELIGFILIFIVGLTTVSCELPRDAKARRIARQCVREEKVKYEVAFKFSKGDFSDDSQNAKCFLKCFAYKIGFFNDTGDFQRDEMLNYVQYVVPDMVPAADILDYCQSNIEKGEDKCDNIYRGYKCFWEGVKSFSDEKKVPFSIYDSLRFDRLLDETEDM